MPLYLLRVPLSHLTFRIPSLLSVAQLYGFEIRFVSTDLYRSVLIVELEKEEHVQHLLDRAILLQWAGELIASADSYDALHSQLHDKLDVFEPWRDDVFRITVEAAGLHLSGSHQREIASSFGYLDLRGQINLSKPNLEFVTFEDYDVIPTHTPDTKKEREGKFNSVYFVRRIGHSRARSLISAHAIKTREYYGNTSMESEMGFLMASQTLAAPGKIIYDPFVGTGSLLYACAQFGAYVMGSDIDGRQMRGKKRGKGVVPGIMRAAAQYGVSDKLLGCMTYDVTRNPMRRGGWLDAIITDPPYGVRAGAKRLGKKPEKGREMRDEPFVYPDGTVAHLEPGYLPPSRPYELTHLTLDLIRLARYLLVPRGRLVFFLPTVTEEYDAIDIPVVEGMKELKWEEGSVQDFGQWGRRLVTMEKTAEDDGPVPDFRDYSVLEGISAGHKDFSKKYATGFRPKPDEANETIAAGEA